jgi:hypothetical protein
MTFLYLTAFIMWIILGIVYVFIRKQGIIAEKSKEHNAVYITRKIYLKPHQDNVIYSLFKGDEEIADDVLSYEDGFVNTVFETIFGKITLNRITKKIVIDEKR